MNKSEFYIDAGTTWSKILEITPFGERKYSIYPTSEARKFEIKYEKMTGHTSDKNSALYVNEVVALAMGAKAHLENNFIALDLGSRDIKWIKYKNLRQRARQLKCF